MGLQDSRVNCIVMKCRSPLWAFATFPGVPTIWRLGSESVRGSLSVPPNAQRHPRGCAPAADLASE